MAIRKRFFIILFGILLMISAIFIIGASIDAETSSANLSFQELDSNPSIPVEKKVFTRAGEALEYAGMPENKNPRSLNDYYKNRAYNGAPPVIPHPLITEKGIGDKNCLQCHQNGGYVEEFNAYTPVTPHPELVNCRQCHVSKKSNSLFASVDWERSKPPSIKNSALESSPPLIPHALQLRENCLACHAGPAAPKEIKVSHPERVNCRQCHAQVDLNSEEIKAWSREIKSSESN